MLANRRSTRSVNKGEPFLRAPKRNSLATTTLVSTCESPAVASRCAMGPRGSRISRESTLVSAKDTRATAEPPIGELLDACVRYAAGAQVYLQRRTL